MIQLRFLCFGNFVRIAAPILITRSPLSHVKCLQKLHASVHAHTENCKVSRYLKLVYFDKMFGS